MQWYMASGPTIADPDRYFALVSSGAIAQSRNLRNSGVSIERGIPPRSAPWHERPTNPHGNPSKSKIEDEDAAGSKGADSAGSRTPASKSGGQEESGKGDEFDIAEFQSGRHRELESVLAKRSEATANPRTIVEEFAAVWLPHHLVVAEVLAPALEEAGFDEDKMAAVKVRKDIVNMLLADLIETRAAEFAMAKLDALADALAAVIQASDEERERVSEAMGAGGRGLSGLGSQMKARYERVKGRFANLDKSIGEAMDMLAPLLADRQQVPVVEVGCRRRGQRTHDRTEGLFPLLLERVAPKIVHQGEVIRDQRLEPSRCAGPGPVVHELPILPAHRRVARQSNSRRSRARTCRSCPK